MLQFDRAITNGGHMPTNNNNNQKSTSPTQSGASKSGIVNKIGEAVEKIGHIVSDAGAPGLGQKIHDLGDKLETKHTNPSHPHKA